MGSTSPFFSEGSDPKLPSHAVTGQLRESDGHDPERDDSFPNTKQDETGGCPFAFNKILLVDDLVKP